MRGFTGSLHDLQLRATIYVVGGFGYVIDSFGLAVRLTSDHPRLGLSIERSGLLMLVLGWSVMLASFLTTGKP